MLIFANVIGLGRPQILNIDVTSKVTVLHLKQRILTHVRGRIIVMLFNGRPLMDNNATIDTLHFSKECTVQVNCARLTDDSVDVFAANHITGPEADAGANSKSSSSNADQHQDTYVLAEPGSNPIDPTTVFDYGDALLIDLHTGHDLVAADFGNSSDPYVLFTLNSVTKRSSVRRSTLSPVWRQSFIFYVPPACVPAAVASAAASSAFSPSSVNRVLAPTRAAAAAAAAAAETEHLVISVWDRDFLFRDDPLGSLTLPLSDIPPNGRPHTVTLALQGVPRGALSVTFRRATVTSPFLQRALVAVNANTPQAVSYARLAAAGLTEAVILSQEPFLAASPYIEPAVAALPDAGANAVRGSANLAKLDLTLRQPTSALGHAESRARALNSLLSPRIQDRFTTRFSKRAMLPPRGFADTPDVFAARATAHTQADVADIAASLWGVREALNAMFLLVRWSEYPQLANISAAVRHEVRVHVPPEKANDVLSMIPSRNPALDGYTLYNAGLTTRPNAVSKRLIIHGFSRSKAAISTLASSLINVLNLLTIEDCLKQAHNFSFSPFTPRSFATATAATNRVAGILSARYPGLAPLFDPLITGLTLASVVSAGAHGRMSAEATRSEASKEGQLAQVQRGAEVGHAATTPMSPSPQPGWEQCEHNHGARVRQDIMGSATSLISRLKLLVQRLTAMHDYDQANAAAAGAPRVVRCAGEGNLASEDAPYIRNQEGNVGVLIADAVDTLVRRMFGDKQKPMILTGDPNSDARRAFSNDRISVWGIGGMCAFEFETPTIAVFTMLELSHLLGGAALFDFVPYSGDEVLTPGYKAFGVRRNQDQTAVDALLEHVAQTMLPPCTPTGVALEYLRGIDTTGLFAPHAVAFVSRAALSASLAAGRLARVLNVTAARAASARGALVDPTIMDDLLVKHTQLAVNPLIPVSVRYLFRWAPAVLQLYLYCRLPPASAPPSTSSPYPHIAYAIKKRSFVPTPSVVGFPPGRATEFSQSAMLETTEPRPDVPGVSAAAEFSSSSLPAAHSVRVANGCLPRFPTAASAHAALTVLAAHGLIDQRMGERVTSTLWISGFQPWWLTARAISGRALLSGKTAEVSAVAEERNRSTDASAIAGALTALMRTRFGRAIRSISVPLHGQAAYVRFVSAPAAVAAVIEMPALLGLTVRVSFGAHVATPVQVRAEALAAAKALVRIWEDKPDSSQKSNSSLSATTSSAASSMIASTSSSSLSLAAPMLPTLSSSSLSGLASPPVSPITPSVSASVMTTEAAADALSTRLHDSLFAGHVLFCGPYPIALPPAADTNAESSTEAVDAALDAAAAAVASVPAPVLPFWYTVDTNVDRHRTASDILVPISRFAREFHTKPRERAAKVVAYAVAPHTTQPEIESGFDAMPVLRHDDALSKHWAKVGADSTLTKGERKLDAAVAKTQHAAAWRGGGARYRSQLSAARMEREKGWQSRFANISAPPHGATADAALASAAAFSLVRRPAATNTARVGANLCSVSPDNCSSAMSSGSVHTANSMLELFPTPAMPSTVQTVSLDPTLTRIVATTAPIGLFGADGVTRQPSTKDSAVATSAPVTAVIIATPAVGVAAAHYSVYYLAPAPVQRNLGSATAAVARITPLVAGDGDPLMFPGAGHVPALNPLPALVTSFSVAQATLADKNRRIADLPVTEATLANIASDSRLSTSSLMLEAVAHGAFVSALPDMATTVASANAIYAGASAVATAHARAKVNVVPSCSYPPSDASDDDPEVDAPARSLAASALVQIQSRALPSDLAIAADARFHVTAIAVPKAAASPKTAATVVGAGSPEVDPASAADEKIGTLLLPTIATTAPPGSLMRERAIEAVVSAANTDALAGAWHCALSVARARPALVAMALDTDVTRPLVAAKLTTPNFFAVGEMEAIGTGMGASKPSAPTLSLVINASTAAVASLAAQRGATDDQLALLGLPSFAKHPRAAAAWTVTAPISAPYLALQSVDTPRVEPELFRQMNSYHGVSLALPENSGTITTQLPVALLALAPGARLAAPRHMLTSMPCNCCGGERSDIDMFYHLRVPISPIAGFVAAAAAAASTISSGWDTFFFRGKAIFTDHGAVAQEIEEHINAAGIAELHSTSTASFISKLLQPPVVPKDSINDFNWMGQVRNGRRVCFAADKSAPLYATWPGTLAAVIPERPRVSSDIAVLLGQAATYAAHGGPAPSSDLCRACVASALLVVASGKKEHVTNEAVAGLVSALCPGDATEVLGTDAAALAAFEAQAVLSMLGDVSTLREAHDSKGDDTAMRPVTLHMLSQHLTWWQRGPNSMKDKSIVATPSINAFCGYISSSMTSAVLAYFEKVERIRNRFTVERSPFATVGHWWGCQKCGAIATLDPPLSQHEVLKRVAEFPLTVSHSNPRMRGRQINGLPNQSRIHWALQRVLCLACHTDSCRRCRMAPYHVGETCVSALLRKSSQQRCMWCDEDASEENEAVLLLARTEAIAAAKEILSLNNALPDVNGEEMYNDYNEKARPFNVDARQINQSIGLKKDWIVCNRVSCKTAFESSCMKLLSCGHFCRGVKDEPLSSCPPCLHAACAALREEAATAAATAAYMAQTEARKNALAALTAPLSDSSLSMVSAPATVVGACGHAHGVGGKCHVTAGPAALRLSVLRSLTLDFQKANANGRSQLAEPLCAEDDCSVCLAPLGISPVIRLSSCGHTFHYECVRAKLRAGWSGARMSFDFLGCPVCRVRVRHPLLEEIMTNMHKKELAVKRLALQALEAEGLQRDPSIVQRGGRFYANPGAFAMDHFQFFECHRCTKPYFAGARNCVDDMGAPAPNNAAGAVVPADGANRFDPTTLICSRCQANRLVNSETTCKKHGTDFISWKCRFCCNIAVFFCFASVHFCQSCHDNYSRHVSTRMNVKAMDEQSQCDPDVQKILKTDYSGFGKLKSQEEIFARIGTSILSRPSKCPLKLAHPPNGMEFSLGCSLCANMDSSVPSVNLTVVAEDPAVTKANIETDRRAHSWAVPTVAPAIAASAQVELSVEVAPGGSVLSLAPTATPGSWHVASAMNGASHSNLFSSFTVDILPTSTTVPVSWVTTEGQEHACADEDAISAADAPSFFIALLPLPSGIAVDDHSTRHSSVNAGSSLGAALSALHTITQPNGDGLANGSSVESSSLSGPASSSVSPQTNGLPWARAPSDGVVILSTGHAFVGPDIEIATSVLKRAAQLAPCGSISAVDATVAALLEPPSADDASSPEIEEDEEKSSGVFSMFNSVEKKMKMMIANTFSGFKRTKVKSTKVNDNKRNNNKNNNNSGMETHLRLDKDLCSKRLPPLTSRSSVTLTTDNINGALTVFIDGIAVIKMYQTCAMEQSMIICAGIRAPPLGSAISPPAPRLLLRRRAPVDGGGRYLTVLESTSALTSVAMPSGDAQIVVPAQTMRSLVAPVVRGTAMVMRPFRTTRPIPTPAALAVTSMRTLMDEDLTQRSDSETKSRVTAKNEISLHFANESRIRNAIVAKRRSNNQRHDDNEEESGGWGENLTHDASSNSASNEAACNRREPRYLWTRVDRALMAPVSEAALHAAMMWPQTLTAESDIIMRENGYNLVLDGTYPQLLANAAVARRQSADDLRRRVLAMMELTWAAAVGANTNMIALWSSVYSPGPRSAPWTQHMQAYKVPVHFVTESYTHCLARAQTSLVNLVTATPLPYLPGVPAQLLSANWDGAGAKDEAEAAAKAFPAAHCGGYVYFEATILPFIAHATPVTDGVTRMTQLAAHDDSRGNVTRKEEVAVALSNAGAPPVSNVRSGGNSDSSDEEEEEESNAAPQAEGSVMRFRMLASIQKLNQAVTDGTIKNRFYKMAVKLASSVTGATSDAALTEAEKSPAALASTRRRAAGSLPGVTVAAPSATAADDDNNVERGRGVRPYIAIMVTTGVVLGSATHAARYLPAYQTDGVVALNCDGVLIFRHAGREVAVQYCAPFALPATLGAGYCTHTNRVFFTRNGLRLGPLHQLPDCWTGSAHGVLNVTAAALARLGRFARAANVPDEKAIASTVPASTVCVGIVGLCAAPIDFPTLPPATVYSTHIVESSAPLEPHPYTRTLHAAGTGAPRAGEAAISPALTVTATLAPPFKMPLTRVYGVLSGSREPLAVSGMRSADSQSSSLSGVAPTPFRVDATAQTPVHEEDFASDDELDDVVVTTRARTAASGEISVDNLSTTLSAPAPTYDSGVADAVPDGALRVTARVTQDTSFPPPPAYSIAVSAAPTREVHPFIASNHLRMQSRRRCAGSRISRARALDWEHLALAAGPSAGELLRSAGIGSEVPFAVYTIYPTLPTAKTVETVLSKPVQQPLPMGVVRTAAEKRRLETECDVRMQVTATHRSRLLTASKMWTCLVCTYAESPLEARKCQVCDADRPAPQAMLLTSLNAEYLKQFYISPNFLASIIRNPPELLMQCFGSFDKHQVADAILSGGGVAEVFKNATVVSFSKAKPANKGKDEVSKRVQVQNATWTESVVFVRPAFSSAPRNTATQLAAARAGMKYVPPPPPMTGISADRPLPASMPLEAAFSAPRLADAAAAETCPVETAASALRWQRLAHGLSMSPWALAATFSRASDLRAEKRYARTGYMFIPRSLLFAPRSLLRLPATVRVRPPAARVPDGPLLRHAAPELASTLAVCGSTSPGARPSVDEVCALDWSAHLATWRNAKDEPAPKPAYRVKVVADDDLIAMADNNGGCGSGSDTESDADDDCPGIRRAGECACLDVAEDRLPFEGSAASVVLAPASTPPEEAAPAYPAVDDVDRTPDPYNPLARMMGQLRAITPPSGPQAAFFPPAPASSSLTSPPPPPPPGTIGAYNEPPAVVSVSPTAPQPYCLARRARHIFACGGAHHRSFSEIHQYSKHVTAPLGTASSVPSTTMGLLAGLASHGPPHVVFQPAVIPPRVARQQVQLAYMADTSGNAPVAYTSGVAPTGIPALPRLVASLGAGEFLSVALPPTISALSAAPRARSVRDSLVPVQAEWFNKLHSLSEYSALGWAHNLANMRNARERYAAVREYTIVLEFKLQSSPVDSPVTHTGGSNVSAASGAVTFPGPLALPLLSFGLGVSCGATESDIANHQGAPSLYSRMDHAIVIQKDSLSEEARVRMFRDAARPPVLAVHPGGRIDWAGASAYRFAADDNNMAAPTVALDTWHRLTVTGRFGTLLNESRATPLGRMFRVFLDGVPVTLSPLAAATPHCPKGVVVNNCPFIAALGTADVPSPVTSMLTLAPLLALSRGVVQIGGSRDWGRLDVRHVSVSPHALPQLIHDPAAAVALAEAARPKMTFLKRAISLVSGKNSRDSDSEKPRLLSVDTLGVESTPVLATLYPPLQPASMVFTPRFDVSAPIVSVMPDAATATSIPAIKDRSRSNTLTGGMTTKPSFATATPNGVAVLTAVHSVRSATTAMGSGTTVAWAVVTLQSTAMSHWMPNMDTPERALFCRTYGTGADDPPARAPRGAIALDDENDGSGGNASLDAFNDERDALPSSAVLVVRPASPVVLHRSASPRASLKLDPRAITVMGTVAAPKSAASSLADASSSGTSSIFNAQERVRTVSLVTSDVTPFDIAGIYYDAGKLFIDGSDAATGAAVLVSVLLTTNAVSVITLPASAVPGCSQRRTVRVGSNLVTIAAAGGAASDAVASWLLDLRVPTAGWRELSVRVKPAASATGPLRPRSLASVASGQEDERKTGGDPTATPPSPSTASAHIGALVVSSGGSVFVVAGARSPGAAAAAAVYELRLDIDSVTGRYAGSALWLEHRTVNTRASVIAACNDRMGGTNASVAVRTESVLTGAAAVADGARVLVFGGQTAIGAMAPGLQVLDLRTMAWVVAATAPGAAVPTPRTDPMLLVQGGALWVLGGCGNEGEPLSDVHQAILPMD